jgi:hypothetical protein
MERLEKKFWDDLRANHPQALNHFCDWLTEYKEKHSWNDIIRDRVGFDDLPFEMQAGIIERYKTDLYNQVRGARPSDHFQFICVYKKHLRAFFKVQLMQFVTAQTT